MKVYFARHGEYQNPDKITPNRLPGFHLTELGKKQAKLQGDKLAKLKLRAIFTSPITRCVETAEIISQIVHLHPNQKPELLEIDTPLVGIKIDDPRRNLPEYLYKLPEHIEGGGETPVNIFERFSNFIEKLKLTSSKSNYLFVSHADPIMIYLHGSMKLGLPYVHKDFETSKLRYIPMGGLVCLDFTQVGIPKYTEII